MTALQRTPLRLLLATLATLTAACGRGAREVPENATALLLLRTPDSVYEHHGRVTPPLDGPEGMSWGAGTGWVPDTREHARPVAFPRSRRATLELVADAPEDRTLALELIAPLGPNRDPAKVADPVTALLNGREIGRLEVGPELERFELDVPSALWVEGTNVLELEIDRLRRIAPGVASTRPVGVGVAVVEYGTPRRVELDPELGRAELAPGTGLMYCVESPAEAGLAVTGRAGAPGDLLVRFGTLDPADGSTLPEALGSEVLTTGDDGHLEATLELPEVDPARVLTVQLRWYPEDEGGRLSLERLHVEAAEPPDRPSILFISIDTLSARHLSCYGYPRSTSPNIDALAADAALFERAIANAPWTAQSYMSQFTGLYPGAHERSIRGGTSIWDKYNLAPNRWTVAESLRAAGYETAAWVDNPWIEPSLGLDQGFDLFDRSTARIPLWDPSGGIDAVVDEFEAWLDDRDDDRPFFALLQALDVHGPYVTDPRYDDLFADDDLYDPARTEPVGHGQLQSFRVIPEHIARGVQRSGELPAELPARRFVDDYDRKVRHVDDAIGRLVTTLRRRGLYDEVAIVFSADHGESLLDHEFYFAHANLFDETIHVPLIVRLPGGVEGGRRIDTPVQLVDLYPTLCDLAGVPARDFLRGRSLVPAARGVELAPRPVWSEGGVGVQYALEHRGHKLLFTDYSLSSPQTKLRHRRLPPDWKERLAPELVGTMWTNQEYRDWLEEHPDVRRLINDALGPTLQLFDLDADPGEEVDLFAVEPALGQELVALALEVLEQNAADRRRASRRATIESMSDERRRQLEELGYLESEK